MLPTEKGQSLSFIASANGSERFWTAPPAGSYLADCETGTRLAREYIEAQAANTDLATYGLLSRIAGDLATHGSEGHKVGFFAEISRTLRSA